MENQITSGSVWRSVLTFSLPYLISYFLQTLYGMADLYIIGLYCGAAQTTAVANGSQIMHMITLVIVGLAMGSTVLIGQSMGAGNREKISRAIGNTVTLFVCAAAVLTCGLIFFVRPLVSLLSTPQEAVSGAVSYLTICFLGIPFITAYNIISAIFRGLGDSRTPMYFVAVACAANIALDFVFIGGCGLGAAGAALGTVCAQTFSVIISLIYLFVRRGKTGFVMRRADLKPHRQTMGQIIRVGLPVALQDGCVQIAFILITIIANRRGLTDAAAVGIVEKIITFLFLVPSAMLSTVAALGAQNIGAGKYDRADEVLKDCLILAGGFGIIISIVMQFAGSFVVGCFTTDAAVTQMGTQYLSTYVLDCFFAGIHFSMSGYFNACGRSEITFLHNILALVLVRVPGAWLMSQLFPQTLLPMGLTAPAGSLLSCVICAAAYVRLRKKRSGEM